MRVDWAHGRACDVKMNQHVYTGAHFSSNTLELPTRSGRWKRAWKQAVLQSSRREGPLVLLPKQVLLNAGTGLDPSVPVHAARAAQRPQPSDEHLRSARRSCSLSQPSRLRIECTRNRQGYAECVRSIGSLFPAADRKDDEDQLQTHAARKDTRSASRVWAGPTLALAVLEQHREREAGAGGGQRWADGVVRMC